MDLSTPAAPGKLLADVQFLVAMIGSLSNVEMPPQSLIEWANSRQQPTSAPTTATAQAQHSPTPQQRSEKP